MIPAYTKIVLLLTVLCLLPSMVQKIPAQEPSAEEILAKSQEAMTQPLRYTITTGNSDMEMTVYQKILADGSIAMLTNVNSNIKKTTIKYGDKSYDLYQEQQIAIDTSEIMHGIKQQAASFTPDLTDLGVKNIYEPVKVVSHNGKDCYEIVSSLSSESKEAFLSKMPAHLKSMFPIKTRYVIDKTNSLTQEQENIGEDGSTLSKIVYKDIQPQSDLTDDFFQLPPGLEIKMPKTQQEYFRMTADIISPPRSRKSTEEIKAEAHEIFEKTVKELEAKSKYIPPPERPPIVVPPPKPTPEHLKRERAPVKESKRPWGMIITANVFLVSLIVWSIYRKWRGTRIK